MIFDMLKRLRSVVYLPNDYVCKKVSGPGQPQSGLGFTATACRSWAGVGAYEGIVGRAELPGGEECGELTPGLLASLAQGGSVQL